MNMERGEDDKSTANDSYKDHLEGQLISQFEVIVEPLYSEQIVEFDRC